MRVEGIYTNDGKRTLYVSQDPESFYNDPDKKRSFIGRLVKAIYVGTFDVSNIKVGSEITVFFGAPISTKNGTFAPILKIEVIK